MRIDASERRLLNRRNKDRIAPAIRAGLIKTPVVVLISATFWLTPAALAQVAENKASIEMHPQTMTIKSDQKIYSKDDLDDQEPEPLKGFGVKMSEQLVTLLKTMGKSSQKLRTKTMAQSNADDYVTAHSVMVNHGEDDGDHTKDVRGQLKSDSERSAGKLMFEDSPFWQKIKDGLDFKFDFASMKNFFSSPKSGEAPKNGSVRYGLILKDIVPNQDHKYQSAAVGNMDGNDLHMAGQADVVWTIGPTAQEEESEIFKSTNYSETLTNEEKSEGFSWLNPTMPSPGLAGNVVPETADLSNAMEQFRNGKKPIMKITLQQEQGYYLMDVKTDDQWKQDVIEHEVRVPIAGNMSLGRRFNEKWDVIRTSLNNILVSKKAPLLSVHYVEDTKAIQTEATGNLGDSSISVVTSSKPTYENPDHLDRLSRYQYQLKFSKKF